MIAQFVCSVFDAISSTVGTCVRVRTHHHKCLVVFQFAHLWYLNAIFGLEGIFEFALAIVSVHQRCCFGHLNVSTEIRWRLRWKLSISVSFLFDIGHFIHLPYHHHLPALQDLCRQQNRCMDLFSVFSATLH